MKRSEARLAVREFIWAETSHGYTVSGERADDLIAKLRMSVEDDEPEFPERLVLRIERDTSLPLGLSRAWIEDARPGGWFKASAAFSEREIGVLRALIAAYNDRPRFRTGDPPSANLYIVRFADYRESDCAWWGGREWMRCPDGPVVRGVTGWMPLPKP